MDNIYGAHRFVDYATDSDDAAQTCPEWHAWMHKMTDDLPKASENAFDMEWEGNTTGTKDAYIPYSTMKPKMHAWTPPK